MNEFDLDIEEFPDSHEGRMVLGILESPMGRKFKEVPHDEFQDILFHLLECCFNNIRKGHHPEYDQFRDKHDNLQ